MMLKYMWLTCVIMTMKLYFRWQKFSLRVLYKAFIWCYSVNACLQYVQNEKCVTEQCNDYGNKYIKWKIFQNNRKLKNFVIFIYYYLKLQMQLPVTSQTWWFNYVIKMYRYTFILSEKDQIQNSNWFFLKN